MTSLVMLGLFGLTAYAAEEATPDESPTDVVEWAETVAPAEDGEPDSSQESERLEAASWLLSQPRAPSAATLALHREWRIRRLELRSDTEIRPGGAWYRHPHHSRYWYQYTGGIEYKVHAWGIYQGFERMNVPDFLEVLGEDELRDSVNLGIRNNRLVATTGFGLAAAGAGVMIAGVFAANAAQTPEEWIAASNLTGAGAITTIAGLFGGSVAGARAHALERFPRTVMPSKEAVKRVQLYNAELRDELSLAPLPGWPAPADIAESSP